MELIYSKIQRFRSFEEQEICYSSRFKVSHDKDKISIHICKDIRLYPDYISNINIIAGKNGAGKSNLCDYIATSFDVSKNGIFAKLYDKNVHEDNTFFNLFYIKESDQFYVEGNSVCLIEGNLAKGEFKNAVDDCNIYALTGRIIDGELVLFEPHKFYKNAVLLYRKSFSPIYFSEKGYNTQLKTGYIGKLINRYVLVRNDVPLSERARLLYIMSQKETSLFNAREYNINIKIEKSKQNIPNKYKDLFNGTDLFIALFKQILQSYISKHDNANANYNANVRVYCNEVKEYLYNQQNFDLNHLNRMLNSISIPNEKIKVIKKFYENYKQGFSRFFKKDFINILINQETSEEEINIFIELLNIIYLPWRNEEEDPFAGFFGRYYIDYLTDGERSIIELFSALNTNISRLILEGNDSFILVLDEPETSMHPEYCRSLINNLIQFLAIFQKKSFQIIISTHSPFILSDVLRDSVVSLESKDSKSCVDTKPQSKTFAQNIHTLLQDAFFMDSTIGEYAKIKIKEIFSWLNSDSKDNKEYYKQLIDLVGDEIISGRLKSLYYKKFEHDKEHEIIFIEKLIENIMNNQGQMDDKKIGAVKQRLIDALRELEAISNSNKEQK